MKTNTQVRGSDVIEHEARMFMKLSSRHLNIVNLMGVCLPCEKDLPPMLLLELCEVSGAAIALAGKPGEVPAYEPGELLHFRE